MKRHALPLLTALLIHDLASVLLAADAVVQPPFRETFSTTLLPYWCENHLTVADLNGDGRKDIALMATTSISNHGPPWRCQAMVFEARADGTFRGAVIADFAEQYGYDAVAADFNRDGAADLILRAGSQAGTRLLLNDGSGRFTEAWAGQPGYMCTAVDFNQDGYLDLLSGTQTLTGGMIELFTNDGTGHGFQKTWESRRYGSGYDTISTVLSVDLNNDGLLDIAAREIYGGLLVTLTNSGGAHPFVERSVVALGARTFALAAGRGNQDALPDLAASVGWGRVMVFTNRGDGTIVSYWGIEDLGAAAHHLAFADFDHDGLADLFVGTFAGGLQIYRNNGSNGFSVWWEAQLNGPGYVGSVADLNDDDLPDLIVGEQGQLKTWINQHGAPRITKLTTSEGGAVLEWTASPGKSYRVQYKSDLDQTNWVSLSGPVTTNNNTASTVDHPLHSERLRIYRVQTLP